MPIQDSTTEPRAKLAQTKGNLNTYVSHIYIYIYIYIIWYIYSYTLVGTHTHTHIIVYIYIITYTHIYVEVNNGNESSSMKKIEEQNNPKYIIDERMVKMFRF